MSNSTLSKGRNFTIESFDIVAVCGKKVECCFDIVAGVDGALRLSYARSIKWGKMREWKMQEWKLQEKTAGVEIAGVEEAGVDSSGGKCRS